MQIPMTYRLTDGEWRDATTTNISISGVLFVAESTLECGAALEMRLVLPDQSVSAGQGRVTCRGEVVRVARTSSDDCRAVAATIDRYRLVHADERARF
jgi:hypothetical protein